VRTGLVVGLIVGLFASAAVQLRPSPLTEQSEPPSGPFAWLERIELALFDLRMRFFAQDTSAEAPIAFVNIDDEAILLDRADHSLSWPWKREMLADLLVELDRLGAKVIVVESALLSERATLDEERAFAARLAPLNKVVFGFGFTELSPSPSPPLGRFAFALSSHATREQAILAASDLLSRPDDALFALEDPEGSFVLWKGGFLNREAAELAAAPFFPAPLPAPAVQKKKSAPIGPPTAKSAPRVRELTTMETFSRVTREIVFSTVAAMAHPDLADFPSTFRSLRLLPQPLLRPGIHFGAAELEPEFDGVIRTVRPVVRSEGNLYPGVALTALDLFLGEGVSLTNTHLFVGERVFALDRQGRLGLRFYGEPGRRHRPNRPYPEVPVLDVFTSAARHAGGRVADRSLQQSIEGKVIFVSRTAPTLHAQTRTPVGEVGSAFTWAMAFEGLLRGKDMVRADKSFDGWLAFAMALVGGLVCALCLRLMRRWRTIFLSAIASLCLIACFVFYLEQAWGAGRWVAMFLPLLAYAIAAAITGLLLRADGMRITGAVWDALGRSLPLDLTERLIEEPKALALDGDRRELTVWLLDLRHFSSWSPGLEPEVLVRLMNEVWTAISDEICHVRGQLDRVMGDAVFAYWGAPLPNRRHALDACRCALAVKALLLRRGKAWKRRFGVDIEAALALSSGELVLGDFGFGGERPRINYTVMGPPLAQVKRLEAMSERWENRILMTAAVHERVQGQVEARLIGAVRLSEQEGAALVKVYELLALKGGLSRAARARLTQFNQAQAHASQRAFDKAIEILEALLEEAPDDLPAQVLLTRCQQSLKMPPDESWDGIFEVR
jgi:class 3 adenylate cyclase